VIARNALLSFLRGAPIPNETNGGGWRGRNALFTVPHHLVYFNMSEGKEDADLAPSIAAGYKISEKKTLDEYTALDAEYSPLIRAPH